MSNSRVCRRRRNGAPAAAPRRLPGLSGAHLPRANLPRPAAPQPGPQVQPPRPPRPPETPREASAAPRRPRGPASPRGLPGDRTAALPGPDLPVGRPCLESPGSWFVTAWPPRRGSPRGFAPPRIRVGRELSVSRGRFSAREHGPSLSRLVFEVWGRNSSLVVKLATTSSDHCPF